MSPEPWISFSRQQLGSELRVGNFLTEIVIRHFVTQDWLAELVLTLPLDHLFFLAWPPGLFAGSLSVLADVPASFFILASGGKAKLESSCYHCSFAKMSDKARGVCSLNVWWNSLGKSLGSGLFFGGSFLINDLFTCYRCSGFLLILKASWVFCVFLGICSFHS